MSKMQIECWGGPLCGQKRSADTVSFPFPTGIKPPRSTDLGAPVVVQMGKYTRGTVKVGKTWRVVLKWSEK